MKRVQPKQPQKSRVGWLAWRAVTILFLTLINYGLVAQCTMTATPATANYCPGDPPVLLSADFQLNGFPVNPSRANCNFSVEIYDSAGDGWEGGSLDVYYNGILVYDSISTPFYGDAYSFTFTNGDSLSFVYNPGPADSENSAHITFPDGSDYTFSDLSLVSGVILTYKPLCTAGCIYYIITTDDTNDGWEGASITVSTPIDTFTYAPTGINGFYIVSVPSGDSFNIEYTPGTDDGENNYFVFDETFFTLFADGPFPDSGVVLSHLADCALFTWSPAAGLSDITLNTPDASPDSTTVYTVTGVVPGCTATATVTVTVGPPSLWVSADTSVCEGGTITLVASGGVTYDWAGPGGFTSTDSIINIPGVTLADSGAYTVTVINALGCSGTQTVHVAVNAQPSVVVPAAGPFCEAGNLSLTPVSDGTTFSWAGPGGYTSGSQNPVRTSATLAMTGLYTVTATSAAGCTATDATYIYIVSPDSLTVTPATDTLCAGQNVQLNAVFQQSLAWSGCGGQPGSVYAPYDTVSIGSGTATVTNISPFNLNFDDSRHQYIVTASELTAAGLSPGLINGLGLQVQSLAGATALDYNISLGCTAASLMTGIDTLTPLTTVYSSAGENPSTGWVYYTFSTPFVWDGTTNLLVQVCHHGRLLTGADRLYSTNLGVARTYFMFDNSSSGCTMTSGTSQGTSNFRPNIRFVQASPWSVSYLWSPSADLSNAAIANPIASPSASVIYTLTATIGACQITATSDIYVSSPDATFTTNQPLCAGQSLQLAAISATGQYNWSGPGGFTAGGRAPDRDNLSLVDAGVYILTVTAPGNCTATSTQNVTVVICTEVCGNGVDDDHDGNIDQTDSDCPCHNGP